uniref:Reverse transcriptase domain-containing protein n=1 Tax=Trichuris muris TaxID=70415 RepID=A0A5S6QBT5_TRIMR
MVLAKGLNFVPTPKEPPVLDIIASVEHSLRSMEPTAAAHIKGAINNTLSSHRRKVTPNMTGLERRTLSELRRNDNIIITKSDKGNVVVLMDRSTYDQKISTLLSNNIYKPIRFDPTDTIRRTLSTLLNNFAMETGDSELCNIRQHIYYTNNTKCPELYGLPKIHKEGAPLRPVVSSINSVTSKLCSYLNTILRPLTGNRSSFVKNSKDFCNDIRQVSVATTDIMVSYDVKDLFTSIPMKHTLSVLEGLLVADATLTKRTRLNPFHITKLVSFCMREGNYFRCQERFFSKTNGAPMGSPLSPILAEIFMEHFEKKHSTPHLPQLPQGFSNGM